MGSPRFDQTSKLVSSLADANVTVAASLPDTWVVPLIEAVDADPRFTHVPVSREESAIGLCAGSFFSGKNAVAIMGTSGFMASIYAITKICFTYQVGFPIVMSLRGVLGDYSTHHTSNGQYAVPIFEALQLPYSLLTDEAAYEDVGKAVRQARVLKRPYLICLPGKPTADDPSG